MTSFFIYVGYIGIAFLLIGYFLLVIGQLKVIDMHYIMLNTLGALLVVVALMHGSMLPLTQTVLAWFFISLYGFFKHHLTTTT